MRSKVTWRLVAVLLSAAAAQWGCYASTRVAGDADGDADGDAPPECASPADCDDGLFCTGQERCEHDVCVSGDPVDCGPAGPCEASECDETADGCVAVPLSVDRDGDGSAAPPCGLDCDDLDPSVREGLPEACNAVDDDCDDEVDEDLARPCAEGRLQVCVAGAWGECDQCVDPGEPVLSGWQEHEGAGPECFGTTFDQNGDPGEYAWATIPQPDDPGWSASATDDASFYRTSALCDFECSCRDGGDFTYLQQFVEIDAGYRVDSFRLTITYADDGARVSIYSPIVPGGLDVGTVALGADPLELELAPHLSTGENRIVVTHVDDCCSESNLGGLTVEVVGHVEHPCGLCADEGGDCYEGPVGTVGVGRCAAGTLVCRGGRLECDGWVGPSAEVCNGLDDDCDGETDEAGCEPLPCEAVAYGPSTYLFCTEPRTWERAREVCLDAGGDLVTIDDAAEDAWVMETAGGYDSGSWWMGLNDIEVEGSFVWADGSPVTYTNWNPGEPNDLDGEDCAATREHWENETWNDLPCSWEKPAVCEI